ncbi:conserved hypothetical protein [sediment metagenome]|uniref:Uncharacterized protein n=1 Tax=sediment metagenome TaxID=749907 RepID=D9PHW8_9ZZZZ
MKNVEMTVDGNVLTIKVDLIKDFSPSSSGKTIIIATAEGNVAVDGHEEAKVGLNFYRKKQRATVDFGLEHVLFEREFFDDRGLGSFLK